MYRDCQFYPWRQRYDCKAAVNVHFRRSIYLRSLVPRPRWKEHLEHRYSVFYPSLATILRVSHSYFCSSRITPSEVPWSHLSPCPTYSSWRGCGSRQSCWLFHLCGATSCSSYGLTRTYPSFPNIQITNCDRSPSTGLTPCSCCPR